MLIYHLITFSDEYIRSIEGRHFCGISMIIFTCFVLGVNLGLLALSTIKDKIMAYRMRWYQKRNAKLSKKIKTKTKTKQTRRKSI